MFGREQLTTTTHGQGGTYGTDDLRQEDGLQLAEGAVSEEAEEVVVDPDLPDDEQGARRHVPPLWSRSRA